MDSQFILDTAYVYAPFPFVVDKHGQTTSILGTFLGTGQYEVKIRVAIRDESFYAVQPPAILFLVEGSL